VSPDGRRRDEQLEGVVLGDVQLSVLDLLLQVFHLLLPVALEAQLLLEAPQNRGPGLHGGLAQHVMENHDLGSMLFFKNIFAKKIGKILTFFLKLEPCWMLTSTTAIF
jgi:hypothetical protein